MTNASRTQVKSLQARVAALTAELNDPYTISLGRSAVQCVQESLDTALAELAKVTSQATKATGRLSVEFRSFSPCCDASEPPSAPPPFTGRGASGVEGALE